ncbi:MAG TPA: hypothetical protein VJL80_06410 [Aeromicrobium sp.]|nr:hypothetical protein [Aeromicrobium sp.]HKY57651.1 hypothetical protein [Aeromicrobium sp.]
MDLGTIAATASTVVALSGVAAWAVQRDSLKVVREQNSDLRADISDKDRRHDEDERTIAQLRSDLEALARVVTNEVLIQAINDVLTHHHERSEVHFGEIKEILDKVQEWQNRHRES